MCESERASLWHSVSKEAGPVLSKLVELHSTSHLHHLHHLHDLGGTLPPPPQSLTVRLSLANLLLENPGRQVFLCYCELITGCSLNLGFKTCALTAMGSKHTDLQFSGQAGEL